MSISPQPHIQTRPIFSLEEILTRNKTVILDTNVFLLGSCNDSALVDTIGGYHTLDTIRLSDVQGSINYLKNLLSLLFHSRNDNQQQGEVCITPQIRAELEKWDKQYALSLRNLNGYRDAAPKSSHKRVRKLRENYDNLVEVLEEYGGLLNSTFKKMQHHIIKQEGGLELFVAMFQELIKTGVITPTPQYQRMFGKRKGSPSKDYTGDIPTASALFCSSIIEQKPIALVSCDFDFLRLVRPCLAAILYHPDNEEQKRITRERLVTAPIVIYICTPHFQNQPQFTEFINTQNAMPCGPLLSLLNRA
ncbi:MAG: hypothetical protein AABW64_01020 [Nanoarchaeota archaeon]